MKIITDFELTTEIRIMVKTLELPQRDRVKQVEKKLEKCRNQENNPDSAMYDPRDAARFTFSDHFIHIFFVHSYKMRMKKMMCDEDDIDLDGSAYQILDSSAADVSMLSTTS